MENTERQLTIGERRVQRNFNPSANQAVEEIKEVFAMTIDMLEGMRNEKNGREISIAQTDVETACMYAVKAQFVA